MKIWIFALQAFKKKKKKKKKNRTEERMRSCRLNPIGPFQTQTAVMLLC